MQEEPPDDEALSDPPPADPRPKWLSLVTVSAIVAGCMFGCCGMWSVGGLFAQQAMPADLMDKAMGGGRAGEAQREYLKRSLELQQEMFPLALTSGTLALGHAGALLAGAILAYRRSAFGRRLLVATLFVGVAVELVTAYVGMSAAQRQNEALKPFMAQNLQAAGNDEESAETARQIGDMIAGVTSVFTWLTVLGFLVVKAAYYLACALYLRRSEVVRFYEEPAPAVAS
jgi:hypothetical protein